MFGQLPVPMHILLWLVSTYCKSAPGICHIIYNNSDTPAKMDSGMFWTTNDIELVSLSYLFWYVLMQIIYKEISNRRKWFDTHGIVVWKNYAPMNIIFLLWTKRMNLNVQIM